MFDLDSPPPRNERAVAALVRRLDRRPRFAVGTAATLFGGTATLYYGMPMIYGDSLPLEVAVIPPAIFSLLGLVGLVGSFGRVKSARELLTSGTVARAHSFQWLVFPVEGMQPHDDLRKWCLPVPIGNRVVELGLEELDRYRNWNHRQTRTIVGRCELADDALEFRFEIPNVISAADVRAGAVVWIEDNGYRSLAYCIPHHGLIDFEDVRDL